MNSSRPKTRHVFQLSLERFLQRFSERCILLTCTFAENVVEKREAERRFVCVRRWLLARGWFGLHVWQRQERGAWHVHLVLTNGFKLSLFPVEEFRRFIVARGWGVFCDVQPIRRRDGSAGWCTRTNNGGALGVVWYLVRYLARNCSSGESDIHLVGYIGQARTKWGTVQFGWVTGAGLAWRRGCEIVSEYVAALDGGYARPGWQWRWRDEIFKEGWDSIFDECSKFFEGVGLSPPDADAPAWVRE